MNQGCRFCGSAELKKVRAISRGRLLDEYKETFGLSFPVAILEANFAFDSVVTYACLQCGTLAFQPSILGDGSYYDFLAKNLPWYYSDQRWEYPLALDILDKKGVKRFLEIGCGDGHFLKLARQRGYEGHGSELNPQSIAELRKSGFEVLTNLAHDLTGRQYDALLMFQVLEHLLDPYSFLTSLLPHVRSGGVMILATPVTPSCCASIACPTLHLVPHHQWLPTALGFKKLAERIGCACEDIRVDPPDHLAIQFGLRKRFGWMPCFDRYSERLARVTLKVAQGMQCAWAKAGHSVLAVLRVP